MSRLLITPGLIILGPAVGHVFQPAIRRKAAGYDLFLPRLAQVPSVGASMPVAFNALVAASVYDLDLEPDDSCRPVTPGGMVLVLPRFTFLFSLF